MSSEYPKLHFLGEASEISKLNNRLPHWQLQNSASFITFRLADSLPSSLLAEWQIERDQWIADHPRPWDSATESEYHRLFSTRLDRALDEGHGSCLLAHDQNAKLLRETLEFRDGKEYLLHSWVIMPNHVHVLMSPTAGVTLSKVVAAWKRFSAIRINKAIGGSGALWQKDYFDRLIRDWDHFANVARYIRRNPEKERLGNGRYVLWNAPWINRLLTSP